jgi:hypothetical protein
VKEGDLWDFNTKGKVRMATMESIRVDTARVAKMASERLPELLDPIPDSYEESLESRDWVRWKGARDKHVHLLDDLRVWKAVTLPRGRKAIKSGYVHSVRRDAEGHLVEVRVRVIAKGFSQILGIDCGVVYSPVVKAVTVRIFFILVAALDLDLLHIDVTQAFLRAPLEEEVYLEPPLGIETDANLAAPVVFRLFRAVPGLRQSGRAWHNKLKEVLFKLGFSYEPGYEKCLFQKKYGEEKFFIADFVDDLGVGLPKDAQARQQFLDDLNTFFPIKAAEMTHFLGMRITRDRQRRTIKVDQEYSISKLASTFKIPTTPISTPMLPGLILSPLASCPPDKPCDVGQYRSLLGSLLYMSNWSRPDIAYAVGYCARFAKEPTKKHWDALVRILQYLYTSRTRGLFLRGDQPLVLKGYVDATWVGKQGTDPKSRSTSGHAILFSGGLVSWRSSVQKRPALSSTDAEILAASDGAREVVWLRNLLSFLGYKQPITTLFEDNKGCEDTVRNGAVKEPLKHISLREQYVIWAAEEKLLELKHVSTKDQLADVFTKPLPPILHNHFVDQFLSKA